MGWWLMMVGLGMFPKVVNGTTFCFELEDDETLCDGVEAQVVRYMDAVGLYDGFEGINNWEIEQGDSIYLAGNRTIHDGAEPLSLGINETTWIGLNCEIRDVVPDPITDDCIQQYSPLRIGGDGVKVQDVTIIRHVSSIPDEHECTQFTTLYPIGIGGNNVTLDGVTVSFKGKGWTGRWCDDPCSYSTDDCIKLTGTIHGGGNRFTLRNSLLKQCGEAGVDAVGEDDGTIQDNTFTRMLENGISIKGGSTNWTIEGNTFSFIKYHPIHLGGISDGKYQESCDYHLKNVKIHNNTVYGRTRPHWGNYLNLGVKIAGVDSLLMYENNFIEASIDTSTGIVLNGCGSDIHEMHNGYLDIR